ncbi:hypothetical protein F5Y19DRAFT_222179 [Xylariaceae sp. FL1651]|nr:hypothetical protein F5Y19DRAFT_222179 [Xylariaceae sp. FL1651]
MSSINRYRYPNTGQQMQSGWRFLLGWGVPRCSHFRLILNGCSDIDISAYYHCNHKQHLPRHYGLPTRTHNGDGNRRSLSLGSIRQLIFHEHKHGLTLDARHRLGRRAPTRSGADSTNGVFLALLTTRWRRKTRSVRNAQETNRGRRVRKPHRHRPSIRPVYVVEANGGDTARGDTVAIPFPTFIRNRTRGWISCPSSANSSSHRCFPRSSSSSSRCGALSQAEVEPATAVAAPLGKHLGMVRRPTRFRAASRGYYLNIRVTAACQSTNLGRMGQT